MNRKIFATLLVGVFLISGLALAQEEAHDWWNTERDVVTRLITLEKDLDTWEAEVAALEPKSFEDACLSLLLALRANQPRHAEAALCLLAEKYHEQFMRCNSMETHVRFAMDMRNPSLARMFYEKFPESVKYSPNAEFFEDWSGERILAWLQERRADAQAWYARQKFTPAQRMWRANPAQVWLEACYQQMLALGTLDAELARLLRVARENPKSIDATATYLATLYQFRQSDQPLPDLTWIVEEGAYPRLLDWNSIALSFESFELYALQERVLLRLVDGELTQEEIDELASCCAAILPAESHRRMFVVGVRQKLAECCIRLGKKEDAQRWMLESNDLCKKWDIPVDFRLAGTTQAFTGQRVVAQEIHEREAVSESDPEYWLQRADYYHGRQELKELELALRKGLALSTYEIPPQSQEGLKVRDPSEPRHRSEFLRRLAGLLLTTERGAEGMALLLDEIAHAPENSASAQRAVWLLVDDFAKYVTPDEPLLWTWLEKHDVWEFSEERLLRHMLWERKWDRKTDLEPYLERAEKLAFAEGADPSRAQILGWIENRIGLAERSIPLLEHAVKHAEQLGPDRKYTRDRLLETAAVTLFESYCDVKDLSRAEEIFFRHALRGLTSGEKESWLERFRDLARETGDAEIAARTDARLRNLSHVNRPTF